MHHASVIVIGAVLLQSGTPIAYFSKKMYIFKIHQPISRSYMRALSAVKKWRQCLLGSHFTFQMDHRTLKNLMEQVILTSEQQHYLSKYWVSSIS